MLKSIISQHQLFQLVEYIKKNHNVYGPQKKDGRVIFDILEHPSDLAFDQKKPTIIFRDILFENLLRPKNTGLDNSRPLAPNNKIAFIGLANCDVWSLHYLLEEFGHTDLLPKEEDILIIASDCVRTENCFCGYVGANKLAPFDLFIQEEKNSFAIFSGSKKGEEILKKNAIKNTSKDIKISEIMPGSEKVNEKKLSKAIDNKERLLPFWQKISDNCFGCGACAAVCPLCFCTREDYDNFPSALPQKTSCKSCLKWDNCFSKQFAEIQHHYDFRPKNVDRLYNWYHHKFTRSYFKTKRFLCTGCGRCIDACPADLNQRKIIENAITKMDSESAQIANIPITAATERQFEGKN